ncbi:hypothetical protein LE190_12385 [Massilia oculi]|uniref:DUF7661 domain-containing protein n=1 Tax=Massilia hydrophila TaxID=3044279 RepID=A0ABS7YCJ5_9BURK|nr:hypothetical protein [Massilia oculi]MCA1856717.1 hypothetical protein [Massilia oculi]
MLFKVFGKIVGIAGQAGSWQAFYPGSDGTRRPADFVIPIEVSEEGLAEYLADLFHEDAAPGRDTVFRL